MVDQTISARLSGIELDDTIQPNVNDRIAELNEARL